MHESIPNMRFKYMGWLRLSLAEAEMEKTPYYITGLPPKHKLIGLLALFFHNSAKLSY